MTNTLECVCTLCGYGERDGILMISTTHNGHAICSLCVGYCAKLLAKKPQGKASAGRCMGPIASGLCL
jgi:hypothetical protein